MKKGSPAYQRYRRSRGLVRDVYDLCILKAILILTDDDLILPFNEDGEIVDTLLFTIEKKYTRDGKIVFDCWDTSDNVLTGIDRPYCTCDRVGREFVFWASEENIDDDLVHNSRGTFGKITCKVYASDLTR